MGVHVTLYYPVFISVPLGIYPEMNLLGHMAVLFLILWGTYILFSVVAIAIYILPTVHKGSLSSTSSPTLVSSSYWKPLQQLILALICISPRISDADHLFRYPLAIWILSLGKKMSIYSLPIFFKSNCLGVSVILDTNPLSDTWFANISPVLYFAFAFCWFFSVAVQRLLSLMCSHLLTLAFIFCVFGITSRISLLMPS